DYFPFFRRARRHERKEALYAPLLDVEVVEIPEIVLKGFELLYGPLHLVAGEERFEEFEIVPELLALYPEHVEVGVRGVAGYGAPEGEGVFVPLSDAFPGELYDRLSGLTAGARRFGRIEERPPRNEYPAVFVRSGEGLEFPERLF